MAAVTEEDVIEVADDSLELTAEEQEVLKDPRVRFEYDKKIRCGLKSEAKLFLLSEVGFLTIHRLNSRRDAKKEISPDRGTETPLIADRVSRSSIGTTGPESPEREFVVVKDHRHLPEFKRCRLILKSDHSKLLIVFFVFNLLLPTADIITDLVQSGIYFSQGDTYWSSITLTLIFLPVVSRLLAEVLSLFVSGQSWISAKDRLQNFLVFNPLHNLRIFFSLLLMDPGLPENNLLVSRLQRRALISGVYQSFIESAPQFVLQLSVILRTGEISLLQFLTISTSFLMVLLSSVRNFFFLRVDRVEEVDPNLGSVAFLLPLFATQLMGYLMSIVFIAAYLRAYVIFFILGIVCLNSLTIWIFVLHRKSLKVKKFLYAGDKNGLSYHKQFDMARRRTTEKFCMAVLTSWVNPNTVWINNCKSHSLFMLVLNVGSVTAHLICVIATFLLLHFTSVESRIVQECEKLGSNTTSPGILQTFALCTNGPDPSEAYLTGIGPYCVVLLVISLALSPLLNAFGNNRILFRTSKAFCSNSPFITTSLCHDYLKDMTSLDLNVQQEMSEYFSYAITFCKKVIFEQDMYGNTVVHLAVMNELYDKVYQLMCAGADFELKNFFGVSARDLMLESLSRSAPSTDKHQKIATLLRRIGNREFSKASYTCIWQRDSPFHQAIARGNLGLACFLHLLGGQVGAINSYHETCQEIFLQKLESGVFNLVDQHILPRWISVRFSDDFGQTLLHIAAKLGLVRALKLLLDENLDVNALNHEDGSSPLHYAALDGHPECVELLLRAGADANFKNWDSFTPLHDAAGTGNSISTQLLLDDGAKVNELNRLGSTPLHLAALWGHTACVELLIDNGADLDVQNVNGDTALHLATWEVGPNCDVHAKMACAKLLIDKGAAVGLCNKRGISPRDTKIFESLVDTLSPQIL